MSGGQLGRGCPVDESREAGFEGSDLGHPRPVAVDGAAEVLQPVADAAHVALDVAEPVDAVRRDHPGPNEPTEMQVRVLDRRGERWRPQPRQLLVHPRGRRHDRNGGTERGARTVRALRSDQSLERDELRFGERHRAVLGHQLVDGRGDAVVDERVDRDVRVGDRHPAGGGDQPLDRAVRRGTVEEQEPPDTATHRPPLELGRRDDPQRHALADVEQGRVGADIEGPVGGFDDVREVTDVPCRDPAALVDRGGGRDRLARRSGEARLDPPEVGADVVDLPVVVRHDEMHAQVRIDGPDVERVGTHVDTGNGGDRLGQAIDESARRWTESVEHGVDGLGERDQVPPDRLGSERISCSTSSLRWPGTCQSKPSSVIWFNAFSGRCTVTPSSGSPGASRYVSGSSMSPCTHTSG